MNEMGLLDLGKTQEHQKPFVQLSSQKKEVKSLNSRDRFSLFWDP